MSNPAADLIAAALAYVQAGRAHLATLNARGSMAEARRFVEWPEWQDLEKAVQQWASAAEAGDVLGLEVITWKQPTAPMNDFETVLGRLRCEDSVIPVYRDGDLWVSQPLTHAVKGIDAWAQWPASPNR